MNIEYAVFRTTDEDYGNQTVFEVRNRRGDSVFASENGTEAQVKCDALNNIISKEEIIQVLEQKAKECENSITHALNGSSNTYKPSDVGYLRGCADAYKYMAGLVGNIGKARY